MNVGGGHRRVQSCATKDDGAVAKAAGIPGPGDRRALAQLECPFCIALERASPGVRCAPALVTGIDPENLVGLDFFRRRHRVVIRQRQQVQPVQLDIHLRQLRVTANQLFYGCPGRGAVEAGLVDGGRRALLRRTDARGRARGEEGGDQGCHHFHCGFTWTFT